MSVYIDKTDITSYCLGIRPGRGFMQTPRINPLALKPGSRVSADLAPGYSFSLYGRLYADTKANLRTLVENFQKYLRPRAEKYRIDYNGAIHYAQCISFIVDEDNTFRRICEWEAQFVSEDPVSVDTNTAQELAQDTIYAMMNNGPGITLPYLHKTVTASVTFEFSDLEGAIAESIASTAYSTTNWGDASGYGSVAYEYEYKLLSDAVRCLKWTSGASQSGNEGGLQWQIASTDLSAENCYTIWVALLADTDQLSTVRVGLGDGTDTGYSTVTTRLSDNVWSWIPVFVRECKKDDANLDTNAVTRLYVLFTPDTNDSIDVYVGGNIIVRNPAKVTIASTSAGFYDMRSGKYYDEDVGNSTDPSITITGKPWIRPGCNLVYQNSSATSQYAYMRSGK